MYKAIQNNEWVNFVKNHHDNQEPNILDIMIPDMLGIIRGKKITKSEIYNFVNNGIRAPRSIYTYDSIGNQCSNLPYGAHDGDPDFPLFAAESTLRSSIFDDNTAQVFGFLQMKDGSKCELDSRYQLQYIIDLFKDQEMSIKIGIELEFYLIRYNAVKQNKYEGLFNVPNSNSVEELDALDTFFKAVDILVQKQNIGIQTIISESGASQFELTLSVSDNVLQACDNIILLKRILKKCARDLGYICCFMAKPFTREAGSGMHVHLSFYDQLTNENLIAGNLYPELETPISKTALYMINGLLNLMDDSIAIFAPNANSYRRFKVGSFAPINKAWGANNRTVAVRLPNATENSARIEHRVAGSDANPYLVVACILIGALHGYNTKKMPPKYATANAYKNNFIEGVPGYWSIALREFAKAKVLKKYFGKEFHNAYLKNREYECSQFHAEVASRDFNWYLGVV